MSYANHATKFEFLGDVTLGRALCAASSSFSSPSTPRQALLRPGTLPATRTLCARTRHARARNRWQTAIKAGVRARGWHWGRRYL